MEEIGLPRGRSADVVALLLPCLMGRPLRHPFLSVVLVVMTAVRYRHSYCSTSSSSSLLIEKKNR